MKITAAGNTVVPAYLALISKGYQVSMIGDLWCAQRNGNLFSASDPLELLGLVAMVEIRGVNWCATDQEIEAFLTAYPPV